MKINKQTYQLIINNSQSNLSKAISLLQLKINNAYEFKQLLKRNTGYFTNLLKLLMKKPTVHNIEKYRSIIYDYFTTNYQESFITCFTKYLLELSNKIITNEKKHKIINIAANIESKTQNITKEIICLELFLIKVNQIMND